jgi:hypothetical protein
MIRDKILGTSMEKLGYKCPISQKWGCRGDVPLSFTENHMSFDGLELHNELRMCQPDHYELSRKKMNKG